MTGRLSLRGVLVAVGIVVAIAATASAGPQTWPGEAPILQVELRYWLVDDLRASAQSSGALMGTDLDLVRDLGVKDDDQPELRLTFMPTDTQRFRFGWTHLGFDGKTELADRVIFNDGVFPAGNEVKATFDQDYFWLNWALRFGGDSFRFGPVLALHGWTAEVALKDRTDDGHPRSYEKYNNFIPAAGLCFDWTPHRVVTVFFEGTGMSQGSQGWHMDAEAGVKIYPIKNLGIVASYRRLEMKNADEDGANFADLSVRGAFVGFDVRF